MYGGRIIIIIANQKLETRAYSKENQQLQSSPAYQTHLPNHQHGFVTTDTTGSVQETIV